MNFDLWVCREEKTEELELPKYRDRAKERREDQNPDYELTSLGSFHAVAPPGTVDLRCSSCPFFSEKIGTVKLWKMFFAFHLWSS